MENNTLLNKLLVKLYPHAVQKMVNTYKNMKTVFLRMKTGNIDEVIASIEDALEEYKGRSEIIKLLITEGYFMDTGIETLRVEYGLIWEIYDYLTFTHYLVRILKIVENNSKRSWIAVYIDENPDTAWWTEEERKVLS